MLPNTDGDDRPHRTDLAAAAASGRPWSALAAVAAVLASEDTDLPAVARRLLLPDEAARGRLFHLACLGAVLQTARVEGCVVEGLRPLGVGNGPAYRISEARSRQWHLWVEGGGMWTYYGKLSPHVQATKHLPGASQPIGADLVLLLPGQHALVVECKYSNDLTYITRNGYEQAVAYQAEALTGLVTSAHAAVLGPDGVLTGVGATDTALGRVSILPPAHLPSVVRGTLSSTPGI